MQVMIARDATATLRRFAGHFPVVGITGPRQSGKTTLARAVFPAKPYVNLEDPDAREFATVDPRGFLRHYAGGAILDEAQRCPQLFSYLQTLVDSSPKPGAFVLTGSQQFGLLAGVTQSLAGRIAILHLLPFSQGELGAAKALPHSIEAFLHRGGYPPIYDRSIPPETWFPQYVTTYIERDVRQIVNVRNLGVFQKFVKMCAARTGQLLNLSSLASDCGITHNTARAWISVLESSYVVFQLPPYHRNYGKRLVKSPKLYFHDSGLAAHLLGIRSPEQLAIHAMRGPLFETWVVSEMTRWCFNRGIPPDFFFWRDSAGHEVDLLVEHGVRLIPLEIKSGETVTDDSLTSLRYWLKVTSSKESGVLAYGGTSSHRRSGVHVVGWPDLDRQVERVLR